MPEDNAQMQGDKGTVGDPPAGVTDPAGGGSGPDLAGLQKQIDALTKRVKEAKDESRQRQVELDNARLQNQELRAARDVASLDDAGKRKAEQQRAKAMEKQILQNSAEREALAVMQEAKTAAKADGKAIDEENLAALVVEFLSGSLATILSAADTQLIASNGTVTGMVTTAGREKLRARAKRLVDLAARDKTVTPPPTPGGTPPDGGAPPPVRITPSWEVDSAPSGAAKGRQMILDAAKANAKKLPV